MIWDLLNDTVQCNNTSKQLILFPFPTNDSCRADTTRVIHVSGHHSNALSEVSFAEWCALNSLVLHPCAPEHTLTRSAVQTVCISKHLSPRWPSLHGFSQIEQINMISLLAHPVWFSPGSSEPYLWPLAATQACIWWKVFVCSCDKIITPLCLMGLFA